VNNQHILSWRNGQTGMPIIDAFMRCLNVTGWITGRGRLTVASYLAQDLKQDWRYGAAYFEERLIDHDIEINFMGWAIASNLGPGRGHAFDVIG
jgi:deoxyribodipyrimidine photo-lyase